MSRGDGWDALWAQFDRLYSQMNRLMNRALSGASVKRHRIETKNGHIVITGEFKSLTVNGKKLL